MDLFKHCSNQKVRKLLARSYLREGRFGQAVLLYLGIHNDCPSDIEVFLVLGNLYLATGSPRTAQALYQRALDRNPSNLLALKQMDEAASRPGCGWEEKDPLSIEAASRLSARLEEAFHSDRLSEICRAVDMLEKPALERGDEMHLLMPALVEMNLNQARAEGFAEMAESLRSLQINLARRLSSRWEEDPSRASRTEEP